MSAHNYYLPKSDADRKTWLTNFNLKLPNYATQFGISPAEITQTDNDTQYTNAVIDASTVFKDYHHAIVEYKNLLMNGSTAPIGAFPTVPSIAGLPASVASGVFVRIAEIVKKIKNNKAQYTDNIGKDLGIVGAEISHDWDTAMPDLIGKLKNGHASYTWHAKGADAFDVQIDLGDGTGMKTAGRFTKPQYLESQLPDVNTSAIYTAKVRYVVNDTPVGVWSNPVSITVMGQ